MIVIQKVESQVPRHRLSGIKSARTSPERLVTKDTVLTTRAGNGKVRMKADAYQVITDRVITLLEQGVIPWQKPWQSGDLMPRNLISKREYRGVNVFLLHAMSYESPFWLTFNQAKELGSTVRRGEKACPVVFWKWLDVEEGGESK